jgi:hypothetical protein
MTLHFIRYRLGQKNTRLCYGQEKHGCDFRLGNWKNKNVVGTSMQPRQQKYDEGREAIIDISKKHHIMSPHT